MSEEDNIGGQNNNPGQNYNARIDKIDMDITDGTIRRTETVNVKYSAATKPKIQVDVTRPYEVKATGQHEGTESFSLMNQGNQVSNMPKVSAMGMIDAIKAAYNAFKNTAYQGGITQNDVDEITGGINDYNSRIDTYKKVAGSQTNIVTSKETKIDSLSESELEKLLKK